MKPFVFEGSIVTAHLGTIVYGDFEFKYTEGPLKGKKFNVKVDEFKLKLPDGLELIEKPNNFFSENDSAKERYMRYLKEESYREKE